MKKIFSGIFAFFLAISLSIGGFATTAQEEIKAADEQPQEEMQAAAALKDELSAPSAILMEWETGDILFEKDADKLLYPASITKIMTMLISVESIDSGRISLDDIVTCSENVRKMTGSRVFLDRGEQISVNELLKSIAVSSGNDASVAMAEHIAGSEANFVEMMNNRAKELGMKNTHFVNCTGLDDPEHVTTARDISIMARELLKHEMIFDYTTIWIDYIRDGDFMLSNTNRLVKFYNGATGLKTGSTSKAKYCLCGTAKRDNMHLIAVVLGAESSKLRFAETQTLLDYGFANYTLLKDLGKKEALAPVPVLKGKKEKVPVCIYGTLSVVVEKGKKDLVECNITTENNLEAPVKRGQKVGQAIFKLEGKEIGKAQILASEDIERLGLFDVFGKLLSNALMINC